MSEKIVKPLRQAAKQTLTFADGFLFGCGFFAAGLLAAILPIAILVALIMLGFLSNIAVR